MPNIWKAFGKADLQRHIGEKRLERLEQLLPVLSAEEFSTDKIYSINGLSRIFDSFEGNQYLQNKENRGKIFNSLSSTKIDMALLAAEILPESISSFKQKVRTLSTEWAKSGKSEKISKSLGISPDILPEKRKKFELFADVIAPYSPYKPLKDYQFSVFTKAVARLDPRLARFIIQMPTGSGKTRTAMEVISYYLNVRATPNDIVLWLAHSGELCEQAFTAFLDTWSHVSTKPLRAIRFWGNAKEFPHDFDGNGFVVSSFQKLYSKVKKDDPLVDFLKKRTSLILIDEAHKVLAPSYKQVVTSFMSDQTRVIGLTATPGRSAVDNMANAKLADFFFSKIVHIEAPEKLTVIEYLREKKVLSHVSYEPIITHRDYVMTEKQRLQLKQFFDLPQDFINKLGQDDIRNVEIVKRLQIEAILDKRILFFACGIEHSKFISALLRCLNIAAVHLDGNTPNPQRYSIIEKFKHGKITVLCNYGVLSTGFDAPQTDVIFISRPTSSIVLYSQMIGRGLRGPEIGGTETCKVIDVIDNIQGFSNENKVYDYFKDYYEN